MPYRVRPCRFIFVSLGRLGIEQVQSGAFLAFASGSAVYGFHHFRYHAHDVFFRHEAPIARVA